MATTKDPLLTPTQIAELCNLHINTITAYHARGQMPTPDQQYGRTPLWKRSTIDKWRAGVKHPNAKPDTQ